jgi:hypothetical protein
MLTVRDACHRTGGGTGRGIGAKSGGVAMAVLLLMA